MNPEICSTPIVSQGQCSKCAASIASTGLSPTWPQWPSAMGLSLNDWQARLILQDRLCHDRRAPVKT
jgi:hypothetical protein